MKKLLFIFTTVLLFSLPGQTQAYLDPGSGSFIIQVVIAGLVGGGVFLRSYLKRFMRLFGHKNSSSIEDEDNQDSE